MAKSVKKRASKASGKQGLLAYFRRNPANAAVVLAVLVFIVVLMRDYLQENPSAASGIKASAPSTTLPRYLPGRNYINYGDWKAADFGHDFGRAGVNGSWESVEGGFGYLISQNYVDILEGRYDVVFRMKVVGSPDDAYEGKVVTIEVARDRGSPVVSRDIFLRDFMEIGVYQDFVLRLEIDDPLNDAEFRVHFDKSLVGVSVEQVSLAPV